MKKTEVYAVVAERLSKIESAAFEDVAQMTEARRLESTTLPSGEEIELEYRASFLDDEKNQVKVTVSADSLSTFKLERLEETIVISKPSLDESWSVFRQGDDGNEVEIQAGVSKPDADALVKELESRGHKQIYWATRK